MGRSSGSYLLDTAKRADLAALHATPSSHRSRLRVRPRAGVTVAPLAPGPSHGPVGERQLAGWAGAVERRSTPPPIDDIATHAHADERALFTARHLPAPLTISAWSRPS